MAYAQSAATLLAGKWTYRSFLNDPTEVTSDPNKAAEKLLALLFAEPCSRSKFRRRRP